MSPVMKRMALCGNGFAAVFFADLAVIALSHGAVAIALVWLLFGGLAAFNFRMFDKHAGQVSEEARLQSELRAAGLRRKLVDMTVRTPETVARHYGP